MLKLNPFRKSTGDVAIIKSVGDHIEKYVGKVAIVFHEKVSPNIHVDIFHVASSESRPFHTLVTCGMSEKSMHVPKEAKDGTFAELMICLPAGWPLEFEAFKIEDNYWPVRLLKSLARYPHENKTWLYAGHSVLCSNPPRPFAGSTKMSSVLVRHPRLIVEEGRTIEVNNGRRVRLWAIAPLYPEELAFKQQNGYANLEELFIANKITELLDPARVNVITPQ